MLSGSRRVPPANPPLQVGGFTLTLNSATPSSYTQIIYCSTVQACTGVQKR